ncbi:MAG: entry exclusion lipoprotein TrbK [Gammaproteobacteria bacterium]|nr:MAG: entry exclusion lipoprotein TrbK [Gammaproteobacteria bacterium]
MKIKSIILCAIAIIAMLSQYGCSKKTEIEEVVPIMDEKTCIVENEDEVTDKIFMEQLKRECERKRPSMEYKMSPEREW